MGGLVPLLYERRDDGSRVEIRVTPWWYVFRWATLPLVLVVLLFSEALGGAGTGIIGALIIGTVVVRLIGFGGANRELRAAMKRGVLEVRGSAWDPREPLRYSYQRQLPSAKVVKDD